MRRLAAQLAAGECDFLSLLAEFDRRDGWGGWGVRSAAHWLSLHCGMRLGAARERVPGCPCAAAPAAHPAGIRPGPAVLQQGACPDQGRHTGHPAGSWSRSRSSHRRPARAGRPAVAHHAGRRAVRLQPAPPRPAQTRGDRRLCRLHAAGSPRRRRRTRRRHRCGPPRCAGRQGPACRDTEETSLAAHLTDEPPIARAGADALVVLAESFLAAGAVGRAKVEVVVHADVNALPRRPGRWRGDRRRSSQREPGETRRGVAGPARCDRATTGRPHRLRSAARVSHRAPSALRRLDPSDGQRQGQPPASRPVRA